MFLRSLQIRGFKTFADKTVLEFAPGVSRHRRPQRLGQVEPRRRDQLGARRAGAARPPRRPDGRRDLRREPAASALGMAEVKLVIDNSAGLIPVPMTEIEISRDDLPLRRERVPDRGPGGPPARRAGAAVRERHRPRAAHRRRPGPARGRACRPGPRSAASTSRRRPGVAKHRKRKERAERKLAGLDQDLLRLQDVLAELRRQLKPLKQQAEMAKRHEELTAEADAVAVKLAAARLRDLLGRARAPHRAAGTRGSRGASRRASGSTSSTSACRPRPTSGLARCGRCRRPRARSREAHEREVRRRARAPPRRGGRVRGPAGARGRGRRAGCA